MRVLVCGSRIWTDSQFILNYLSELSDVECIIEGDARGADKMAGDAANLLNIPVEVYKPNWGEYGKAAGIIRNGEMLKDGKPDLVVAFSDDIENSKGTKHMVSIAERAGVETVVVTH